MLAPYFIILVSFNLYLKKYCEIYLKFTIKISLIFYIYCNIHEMKRFWTMKVTKRGVNIGGDVSPPCCYLMTLSTVFLLTACDTLEGVGNAVGGWTDSIS